MARNLTNFERYSLLREVLDRVRMKVRRPSADFFNRRVVVRQNAWIPYDISIDLDDSLADEDVERSVMALLTELKDRKLEEIVMNRYILVSTSKDVVRRVSPPPKPVEQVIELCNHYNRLQRQEAQEKYLKSLEKREKFIEEFGK